MNTFQENDCVIVVKPVDAKPIGERREIVLPIGTKATIVLAYNNSTSYEIEAYLSDQDVFSLATVEATDIELDMLEHKK